MPRWASRASAAAVLLGLVGCAGETPDRARIASATLRDTGAGWVLEVEQQLRFSPTMLEALSNGIPLRLAYTLDCAPWRGGHAIELRYAPLQRAYTVQPSGQEARRFGRRSAMLSALDRVRLPLPEALPADCPGGVRVVLDLTGLPTPLRFPALLRPEDWRMVSPKASWQAAAR
ncbi:DUF4390 domain-containing protein [Pseudomarimonas salicorniae]|uniref:DUF4390 domain-containing protein n=1 Tax=Pseudomarimonas salicorniae TaxID=2933270 RepID=A0ABT0GKM7_9GAMM|nr:DUF4390 domain-containing protein [Lysobacter sp. CAU 1642]MCK7595075.1 DUF4390 domain-containing protein [Lysobacter sp. CAU 1642]